MKIIWIMDKNYQTPSSALIYDGKPYSFESEPLIVAFRTEQHNADPAQNNIYKYNVLTTKISGLKKSLT